MKLSKLSKNELYLACMKDGYIMPKLTSSACRMQYMVNVRSGNEYCPRKDEIQKPFNCQNPPKKVIMLQIIFELLQQKGDKRSLSFDEKHLPDVDWCLQAIFALHPDHPIFENGYKPALEDKGRRGCKFNPKAEELIYMLEYQSSSSKKTQVMSLSDSKLSSSQERKRNSQIYQDLYQECDLQNQILQKQEYSLSPEHFQQSERNSSFYKQKNNFMNIQSNKQSFFFEKPQTTQVYQESNYDEKSKPLVKMLRALQKKGLLDDYFLQFIDIQEFHEEHQKENFKQLECDSGLIQNNEPQKDNIRKSKELELSNQQFRKYNHKFIREKLYEEDKVDESQFQNSNNRRSQYDNKSGAFKSQCKQTPVKIQRMTMNKLLDETEMNPDEYEAVYIEDSEKSESDRDSQKSHPENYQNEKISEMKSQNHA